MGGAERRRLRRNCDHARLRRVGCVVAVSRLAVLTTDVGDGVAW